MTIDLGCGTRKRPGAIGTDICRLEGVDVICDLERFPYPFATDSADEIQMSHVLEHLDDTVKALTEVWRINKPGGKVHIRVPHHTGPYAWRDPTHKRCFASQTFQYFGPSPYSYYTPARFRVVSLRMRYFMEPPARRIYRWWGAFIQRVLDRHPTFGERFLAYMVGGIDEIQVTLEAVKRNGEPQRSR